MLFEDGKPIDLDATENNKTTATVTIEKDGTYHIGVMDHGEMVRLTDDYFIEARKVSPPTVQIYEAGPRRQGQPDRRSRRCRSPAKTNIRCRNSICTIP